MDDKIIILGLKKSAVVLHGIAYSFEGDEIRKETLALVDCIQEAIKELEVENVKKTNCPECSKEIKNVIA